MKKMKVALMVTYEGAYPGREHKAFELGAEIDAFFGKMAAEGKCSAAQQFISPATGKGLWLVKGDRATIEEILDTEEAKLLDARCTVLLRHYTWELVLADEEVDAFLMRQAKALESV
ncbi:MAG TPA: hypothetical protein VFZ64_01745 [Nocardioidaceae bacterium]